MTKPHVFGRFLFLLARVLGLLPLALLRTLGALAGWISYRLDSRETHVARRNMQLICPDDSPQQRELKVKGILKSSGQTLFETLAVWTRPRQRALTLLTGIHGREHLDNALAKGKGVIVAGPHYGNWELLLKFLADKGPLSLVYRVPNKPYGDDFLNRARGGANVTLVPAEATAMRPLLKALQRGETVGITPDQQPKQGGGEFAPFFGVPALTLSLIAKLASRNGTPVVFAFTERSARGFEVHFEAEEPAMHDPDLIKSLSAMNSRVEAIAKRDFRQYQWTYKRFSIRPDPSEKSPYK
jgi:Kdo2-lipid IVA lauroyltransferase/acyltransferase